MMHWLFYTYCVLSYPIFIMFLRYFIQIDQESYTAPYSRYDKTLCLLLFVLSPLLTMIFCIVCLFTNIWTKSLVICLFTFCGQIISKFENSWIEVGVKRLIDCCWKIISGERDD